MTRAVRLRSAVMLLALSAILLAALLVQPGTGGAAGKAAAFTVVAGQSAANAGINFNGTSHGKLIITVPLGAQVEITLTNKGDLPHSLQIIPYTTTQPGTAAAKPVFPGAETPNPQTGINKGQTAVAKFTASKPGKYLFICGFPGHALLGMYGVFEVSASASTAPSMTTAK